MSANRKRIIAAAEDRAEARVTIDGKRVDPRHDLGVFSTAGFDWGRDSLGTRQLALALVAAVTGDDVMAQACCYDLADGLLSHFTARSWEMDVPDLEAWLEGWRRNNAYQPSLFSGG